jgi:hypothetical protein
MSCGPYGPTSRGGSVEGFRVEFLEFVDLGGGVTLCGALPLRLGEASAKSLSGGTPGFRPVQECERHRVMLAHPNESVSWPW